MNPWFKLLISGAFGAILFSPAAYAIDIALGDTPAPGEEHVLGWLEELAAVLLPVSFTWVVINIPFNLGFSFRRTQSHTETDTEEESAGIPEPRFVSLLDPQLRGEVVHMKSELHYLSVTTTRGRGLILYTLRDAASELPHDSGIQTHRSYWASLNHVKKLEKTGRSGRLIMNDGESIPVSRSNMRRIQTLLEERMQISCL